MNQIKIYVDNIKDVKEWSFDVDCGYGLQKAYVVTFTGDFNAYGSKETKEYTCSKEQFENIKKDGYYYG